MTDDIGYYWTRYAGPDGWIGTNRPSGADLAALRSGLGRRAGTVPAMWRLHVLDIDDAVAGSGYADTRYVAEHHALTLYGVHQQSITQAMHRPGVGVGRAVRALHAGSRQDDDGRSQAIDRRFYAAVTANTVDEVAHHLRGLVQLLRALDTPAGLDYSRLVDDLAAWDWPERRDRARLRWGKDYHAQPKSPDGKDADQRPTTIH